MVTALEMTGGLLAAAARPRLASATRAVCEGRSLTDALAPHDARALAGLVRADEYLTGTVTKIPTGFRIEANLVLARDNRATLAISQVATLAFRQSTFWSDSLATGRVAPLKRAAAPKPSAPPLSIGEPHQVVTSPAGVIFRMT